MHAEVVVGNSIVMLSEENCDMRQRSPETLNGTPVSLFVYLPDVDAAFKKAVDAGAKPEMPPTDMFWGDRFGSLTDPFGHVWMIATHKEDVSEEEMARRMEAFQGSSS